MTEKIREIFISYDKLARIVATWINSEADEYDMVIGEKGIIIKLIESGKNVNIHRIK